MRPNYLLRFGRHCSAMDAYNVIDAFSQAFFALLAIWAAVDRRHWFIRFVVVSGALLVTLLIPSYEVIIEFGLQMTLITAGVWLYRGERHWPPRLSLETALLATVVVAVAAAVIAHVPNLQAGVWAYMLNVGVSTALFALLTLWVVFGEARLHVRLVLAPLALVLFIGIFHFGSAIERMLWRTSGSFTWPGLREAYAWQNVPAWLARNLPTVALAAPVMITVLWLARQSQWFDASAVRTSTSPALPRRVIAARAGLCVMMLIVVAPLVLLFYRLLTPPPLASMEEPPSPNGFDDFVAAGHMAPLTIHNAVRSRPAGARLKQLFTDLQPVADRVDEGLLRNCMAPLDDTAHWGGASTEELLALDRSAAALWVRAEHLRQSDAADEYFETLMKLLSLEQKASHGSVRVWESIGYWQDIVTSNAWSFIHGLNSQQLRDLAAQLQNLDQTRQPFDAKIRRQVIYDENAQWTSRLNYTLDRWSGKLPYEGYYPMDKQQNANKRLLIAHLAAQAFFLEHKRPPQSLDELVPKHLSEVPRDPYVDAPLRYRRDGVRYVIYSVGPDGLDDNEAHPTRSNRDDSSVAGPHLPPLWTQLRDAAAAGWNKLEEYIHREGEAPAEP